MLTGRDNRILLFGGIASGIAGVGSCMSPSGSLLPFASVSTDGCNAGLKHRSSSDVTGGYIIINVDRLRGPVELISERILELKEPKD